MKTAKHILAILLSLLLTLALVVPAIAQEEDFHGAASEEIICGAKPEEDVFSAASDEVAYSAESSAVPVITRQPKSRFIKPVKKGSSLGTSTSTSVDLGMQVDVPAGSENSLYYGIHFIGSDQKPIVQKYSGKFSVNLSFADGDKPKTGPAFSFGRPWTASKDIDFYVSVGYMEGNAYKEYAQSDPVKVTLFLRFGDAIAVSWEATFAITVLLLGGGIIFAPLFLIYVPSTSLYYHIASLFN